MNKNRNNSDLLMEEGTMTIDEFIDMVKDALSLRIDGCTVEAQEVIKNNGVRLHGIRIMEQDVNISPCIYLDTMFQDYQNGRDFSEIVSVVVENYQQNRQVSDFDTTFITDYEKVKERIRFKVVNTDLNKELLSEVPHFPFYDLSVVFYVLIDEIPEQNGSVLIRNQFLESWGVDKDTLWEVAKSNTEKLGAKVIPINTILDIILSDSNEGEEDEKLPEDKIGMFIASNTSRINGAAVLLNEALLTDFADRIGKDYYIIPSSVHELIFLPDDVDMEPGEIRCMIEEINSTSVEPEEVLSNSLYRYQRKMGRVELVA